MWEKILGIFSTLIGWFSKPTPEAAAESTGEDAGKAKQQAAADETVISEVKTAEEVRAKVEAEQKPGVMPRDDDGFRRD